MGRILYLQSLGALAEDLFTRLLERLGGDEFACGAGYFPERGGEAFIERWSSTGPEQLAGALGDWEQGRPLLLEVLHDFDTQVEREDLGPYQVRDAALGRLLFVHDGDAGLTELPGEESFASPTRRISQLLEDGEADFMELLGSARNYGVLAGLNESDRLIWKRNPEDAEAPGHREFGGGALHRGEMRYQVYASDFHELGLDELLETE